MVRKRWAIPSTSRSHSQRYSNPPLSTTPRAHHGSSMSFSNSERAWTPDSFATRATALTIASASLGMFTSPALRAVGKPVPRDMPDFLANHAETISTQKPTSGTTFPGLLALKSSRQPCDALRHHALTLPEIKSFGAHLPIALKGEHLHAAAVHQGNPFTVKHSHPMGATTPPIDERRRTLADPAPSWRLLQRVAAYAFLASRSLPCLKPLSNAFMFRSTVAGGTESATASRAAFSLTVPVMAV